MKEQGEMFSDLALEQQYDNMVKQLKKPKLEDFYDTSDPRGCSSSEYDDYQKALDDYLKENKI